jgi:hypothetical protein
MDTWSEREIRRQAEQQRLDVLLGNGEKNKLGQFATPPSLAVEIMEYLRKLWHKRAEGMRFLEPALGTGAFYSALRQVFPEQAIDESVGIEIDPNYADAARSTWQGDSIQIVQGDFTRQRPPSCDGRFNLIATNPPYVRHHHLSPQDKMRLKRRVFAEVGITISGLAGFYCYFLLLADQWLADRGLSAWLLPSEFMDVNYGIAVKRYLTKNVRLLHIHRFCPVEVQFSDALVSSAVVIFEKSSPALKHRVSFSYGGSLKEPQLLREVSLESLKVSDKWTRYAMLGTDAGREKKAVATLGDFFTIKRGLATGDNDFFILDKNEATRLGIPAEFLKPILPSPRMLSSDIINADESGFPLLKRQLVLIDCDLPEPEIKLRFPNFWTYLQTGKEKRIDRGYLASRRSPWYSQEKRPPAPLLCTYMGRTSNGRKPFRFVWNRSKATAHNVYLLLYPKPFLAEAMQSDSALESRLFEALRRIDTTGFTSEGRVYGGGLYKMEPKELSQISSPSLSSVLRRLRRKASTPNCLHFSFVEKSSRPRGGGATRQN